MLVDVDAVVVADVAVVAADEANVVDAAAGDDVEAEEKEHDVLPYVVAWVVEVATVVETTYADVDETGYDGDFVVAAVDSVVVVVAAAAVAADVVVAGAATVVGVAVVDEVDFADDETDGTAAPSTAVDEVVEEKPSAVGDVVSADDVAADYSRFRTGRYAE